MGTEDTDDENLEDYSDYPDKELIAKKDMATVLDALAESGKKGGKEARDKYSKMNTTMQHKLQKKLHSAYGEDVDAREQEARMSQDATQGVSSSYYSGSSGSTSSSTVVSLQ